MNTTRLADLVGEAHLVRDHDHGHALVGKLLHHRQHLADQLGVEGRGDLVEQQHLGLHRHGAGDADPLLLAAGELRRQAVELVGEADPLQPALGDRARLRPWRCRRTLVRPSMTFSTAVRCGNR